MTKTATPFLRQALATLIGGTAIAVFAVSAPAALAAGDTNGFQISPPVTEYALDPGTSTRGVMKVTNLTDTQMTLTVDKSNFAAKGEEGEVELTDNADPRYSLAPWFNVLQQSVIVPPRSTEQVAYTISVPTNAEPGGRYGSISFNTIPPALPNGQSGASVKQQLAALIFLRINGPANEQLSIASFTTGKNFYEYGPVGFSTRIKNEGNVHEKPSGQIVVKNMLGLTTATIALDQKNVIPDAIRHIQSTLKKKWMFGYYTAHLTVHNGSKQTLTAAASFTVIPYKLLAIILVILAILIFLFTKTRKRFGRAFRILAGRE